MLPYSAHLNFPYLSFFNGRAPPTQGLRLDVGGNIIEIRYRISIFGSYICTRTLNTSMSDSDKDLYSGLIRLHVLHHAAARPIYGSWMIEELREHGYEISPGTLYPMLHGLARKGYLKVRQMPISNRDIGIFPDAKDIL